METPNLLNFSVLILLWNGSGVDSVTAGMGITILTCIELSSTLIRTLI